MEINQLLLELAIVEMDDWMSHDGSVCVLFLE